jgi:hypothetical protein
MEPVANLKEALTAFTLGYFDEPGLVEFVSTYLDANPELYSDGNLAEIVCLNRNNPDSFGKVGGLLARYVRSIDRDFDAIRDADESLGKRLLKARLELYLSGSCAPSAVCRLVSPIETTFDWPSWLGNLYNACDWIDDNYEPHRKGLRDEAKRLVRTL